MDIRLHKNATTTPARRAAIQASDKPVRELAREFGVSEDTIRRWRKRETTEDGSHTAHRLRTTLTPEQEAVVVALRRTLWLSLEDMLAVTREFLNENASRSAVHRLLKRHGISTMPTEAKPRRPSKPFQAYDPGYLHVDVKYLPQMADEDRRRYLFVAIDRATRWVFVDICADKSASTARRFLRKLHKACPVRIRTLLTDNGKEFTDRLFGVRAKGASGDHEFDQLCEALGIEHRLTRPKTPQTNGMVERFNGRISEVLATHHFDSRASLEQTLKRYVHLYNHHLPQKALDHQPPIQAMKSWYAERPDLFHRKPRNHPGPDS
ncbi:Transposase and inactivated derivatives, IS30 family [Thiohalospira halophila DSM 15071]|nr:IS481 family transposase [Thiohalospira halophila]SFD82896.1 Transposase and inactivated derivatives, IS30 family [Thiohalospira halophila DSM 15071]